ncbi:transposase [Jeotgalibacillus sp. R-1-5s-1]|uniref:transposase n=1 Tax=Jeotgalibacillus sp. R-1-5s-1 TaxID=2555897 RepID=UPI00106D9DB5|nr:transposase [Jeotgalibacillus sp. R-1-5s-1]TFD99694.1 transposase [Jeotgalibacillus sp. R-1-5s-1]TFE00869.1 transposase [Jeotgalibacillus sp. R-1-5s-1]
MRKQKRPEEKEYIAKLYIEEGRKATDLAYEYDVHPTTVREWGKAYRLKKQSPATPDAPLLTPTEIEQRLHEAEKALKERDEEIEILKKAMHVFAKSRT